MNSNLTRRSWLRITIRGALAITAMGAGLFALFRKRLDAAYAQEIAVQTIEGIGGHLGYAHQWDDVADRHSGLPTPGPKFVRSITGDHFYLVPNLVMFDEFEGGAAELAPVGELTTLTHISITHAPNIDDSLVDLLLRLPDLEVINLYNTSLTLDGLSRLRTLPKLRMLHVSHTIHDACEAKSLSALFPDGVVLWSDEPYVRTSDLFGAIEDAIETGT